MWGGALGRIDVGVGYTPGARCYICWLVLPLFPYLPRRHTHLLYLHLQYGRPFNPLSTNPYVFQAFHPFMLDSNRSSPGGQVFTLECYPRMLPSNATVECYPRMLRDSTQKSECSVSYPTWVGLFTFIFAKYKQ